MEYQNAKISNQSYQPAQAFDTEPSNSRLRDSVSNGEQYLSEIHATIDALEKRLDTLLTPQAPSTAANSGVSAPQPLLSHVVGRLNILNEGYVFATARMRTLISRIAL